MNPYKQNTRQLKTGNLKNEEDSIKESKTARYSSLTEKYIENTLNITLVNEDNYSIEIQKGMIVLETIDKQSITSLKRLKLNTLQYTLSNNTMHTWFKTDININKEYKKTIIGTIHKIYINEYIPIQTKYRYQIGKNNMYKIIKPNKEWENKEYSIAKLPIWLTPITNQTTNKAIFNTLIKEELVKIGYKEEEITNKLDKGLKIALKRTNKNLEN